MATLAFSLPPNGQTVRDVESRIESLLNNVRRTDESTPHETALALLHEMRSLLSAPGLRAVVQLEEEGRKKRSTAAASNWKHDSGEVVIFFEPDLSPSQRNEGLDQSPAPVLPMQRALLPEVKTLQSVPPLSADILQCCEALDSAAAGRDFVAFKNFRDLVLPAHRFAWVGNPGDRQRVLTAAIEAGAIQAKKIPNPKSPSHPTTVISVVRKSVVHPTSRFKPITALGEEVSTTIQRDRG